MAAAMATLTGATRAADEAPQLGKAPLQEVVKALTLEEKVRLVVGTCQMQPLPPFPAPGTFVRPPYNGANTASMQGKVAGSAGESYAVERLGIPSLVYADGPAGVRIDPTRKGSDRTYYATAFPTGVLLASTWNPDMVRQVGRGIGSEAHEYGVDIMLCPGMNIQRNPLCGRNFEYYGEDPLLAGTIATAMVQGIQAEGVGTSVKHFAVNNQETFRNGINVIVSERALREIYLRGFEKVVKEAQPWTIMSSYNKINGTYASEASWLLTDILRGEWGYQGFVMTDWWAEHNEVAQIKAGNDLLMPGTEEQIQNLLTAVREGRLDESVLDRNVENILRITLLSPAFHHYTYSDLPDIKSHQQITRRTATEGMVLLKNEAQTLPLKKRCKPALFGVAAYDLMAGGSGSGYVYKAHKINLLQGLQESGVKVNRSLADTYQSYIGKTKSQLPEETFWTVPVVPERTVTADEIATTADNSDIAIITIGRSAGEGSDRQASKGDYELTDLERRLVHEVSDAYHAQGKKVVVVLNISSIIDMASWRDDADAILLCWHPGQEGGYSLADVLLGKVSPSGHLPVSIPMTYTDNPSADNFPLTDLGNRASTPACVVYGEDIFVGYRYFTTKNVATAYPFGHGLSYTSFEYSPLTVEALPQQAPTAPATWQVTFNVTNNGRYAGKEVAQLYATAPEGRLPKPVMELKAFAKTQLLQPGESQRLTLTITARDLASWDADNGVWLCEPGTYTLHIGSSSTDIRQRARLSLSTLTYRSHY